jgi:hypothetical protein
VAIEGLMREFAEKMLRIALSGGVIAFADVH